MIVVDFFCGRIEIYKERSLSFVQQGLVAQW